MGIIGKVWNINANSSASKNVNASIDYIVNEEKCDKVIEDDNLYRELDYISDHIKTLERLYVGGVHIFDLEHPGAEMMAIKAFYGKEDKRVALHGIISLEAEESTNESASKLMLLANDFLKEIFPNHQAVFAVHTNTNNYHVHFIVNTVSLDGKKIHMGKNFMKGEFQPCINKLARKYGFSPNEEWNNSVTDSLSLKDRKIKLREVIDLAIERSDDFSGFVSFLKSKGYKVNVGKYLSLKSNDMQKAIRSYTLGQDYSIDRIRDRIIDKRKELRVTSVDDIRVAKVDESINTLILDTLKPYKSLSKEEKIRVVKLLKLGRNPWKETNTRNWMIKEQDDRINADKEFVALVKHYAPLSLEPKSAMEEIIRLRKNVGENIKEIRADLKKNRQLVNLVKKALDLEKRAFNYETTKDLRDFDAYVEYNDIKKRVEENFDKTLVDVARYIEKQEGNILYLKAQQKELKEQYRIIYDKVNPKSKETLFELVGHSKAKEEAYYYGIYTSDSKYIYDKDSGYYIYVQTTPGIKNGKPTIDTRIDIYNEEGRIINTIDSRTMDARTFNREINQLEKQYNLANPKASKERPTRQRNV